MDAMAAPKYLHCLTGSKLCCPDTIHQYQNRGALDNILFSQEKTFEKVSVAPHFTSSYLTLNDNFTAE